MVPTRSESRAPKTAPGRVSLVNWALFAVAIGGVALLAAAFWLSDSQPNALAPIKLEAQAAAYRSDLVSRLRIADQVLRAVAGQVAVRGPVAALVGATKERAFQAISYRGEDGQAVALLGELRALPELRGALPQRLAQGETAVVAAPHRAGNPVEILMVRGLLDAGRPAALIAAVDPQWLWAGAGGSEQTDLCLRDAEGAPLHCSSARALAALGALHSELSVAAGSLSWRSGADNWGGAYLRLDLPAMIAGGNWVVLALASPPPAAPGQQMVSTPALLALSASLFGALAALGFLRVRRAGTEAVDRSKGLVVGKQHLAAHAGVRDPNPAARSRQALDAQGGILQAIADLNRAALSQAQPQRLIDLAIGHLLACTGTDLLLIGLLDRDIEGRIRLMFASREGESLSLGYRAVDPTVTRLLAIPPDGLWMPGVGEFSLLVPLAQRGVRGSLVLPIYSEAGPGGIIALGLTSAETMGAAEASAARAIVGALSLALLCAGQSKTLRSYDYVDATTGLPNREYLKTHLTQKMKEVRRERSHLAMLFVGLDGFKKVNASGGHGHGDLVLAEAARRLRRSLREQDLVVRFGGDEFVVVLFHIAEGTHARRVADKLLDIFAMPFVTENVEHNLGCSIGISVFPDDAKSVDEILHAAASALADAKAAGRGRYAFFDADLNRDALALTKFERDLRRAVLASEFSVVYQPQIDLRTGRIEGAEALVRWHHPTRGVVCPAEFIVVAERTGLIAQIGEQVMRAACLQFRAWETEGIAPKRVAVNVSAEEIARSDFVGRVERVLRETGLRPMFLELELTEGMFLGESGENVAKLRYLQQRGVSIALDDFGTGYSSLRYLKRLPIDTIKIDQSFVSDLVADEESRQIVRAILELAQSLGKGVVAEGVETEEQRLLLARWGCEVAQGYLWSRPLTGSDFAKFGHELTAFPQPETAEEG